MLPNADPVADFQRTKTELLNTQLVAAEISRRLTAVEAELKSLTDVVRVKNEKILKLETENVRLKMQRTDAELAVQVDGLRAEVGKKDRELVELRRRITALQENEALTLRRASAAEEKIKVLQTTLGTFQRARDNAHADVERHDRERLEAVRQMLDAVDRAKRAEARVAELEKVVKAPVPSRGAPKK